MNEKLYKRLEFWGAGAVFLVATGLHFLYDLNQNVLTALLGAVNESIWEHMKIFAIGYIFWGVIEYLWARPLLKKFVVSKAVGVFVMIALIPAIYYSYTLFTKGPLLIVDMLTGFSSAAVGFLVSCKLYFSQRQTEKYFYTALMMLFLLLMMILCFTFYPPESELFRDVVTDTFGIPDKNLDMGAFALEKVKNIDIF